MTDIRPGDTVRATWEGVTTRSGDGRAALINGTNAGWFERNNFTFEVVKRAPRPLPTEPGTVIRFDGSDFFYALNADGRWWNWYATVAPERLLEIFEDRKFTVYRPEVSE